MQNAKCKAAQPRKKITSCSIPGSCSPCRITENLHVLEGICSTCAGSVDTLYVYGRQDMKHLHQFVLAPLSLPLSFIPHRVMNDRADRIQLHGRCDT